MAMPAPMAIRASGDFYVLRRENLSTERQNENLAKDVPHVYWLLLPCCVLLVSECTTYSKVPFGFSAQPERVPRRPSRPRALPLGVGALRAPLGAAGVRVAVRRHPRLAASPVAARGHGRIAREAVAVGAGRLVAIGRRCDRPLGRKEGVEGAERPLVRQVLGQQACAVQALSLIHISEPTRPY